MSFIKQGWNAVLPNSFSIVRIYVWGFKHLWILQFSRFYLGYFNLGVIIMFTQYYALNQAVNW